MAVGLIEEWATVPYFSVKKVSLFSKQLFIIDYNDNQMTFLICRAYSLFVSLEASFASSLRTGALGATRALDATRATNKLYGLQKSCDCPII